MSEIENISESESESVSVSSAKTALQQLDSNVRAMSQHMRACDPLQYHLCVVIVVWSPKGHPHNMCVQVSTYKFENVCVGHFRVHDTVSDY